MSTLMAEWQSGYAAACKAVDSGSIPLSASNTHLLKNARKYQYLWAILYVEY